MRQHLVLGLILLTTAVLHLTGIRWGLPDDRYRQFFYSSREQALQLATGVSPAYLRESWSISRASPAGKLPRSTFNIIRSFHPDEHNILKSISTMDPARHDLNPHFFEYPTFYIYLVAALLKMLSLAGILTVTSDISYYFLHPSSMGELYLAGRCLTVFFGLLGVLFVYHAARHLFDSDTGLFAALLLCLTPLYAINGHFLTVDVPMTALACGGVYLLVLFLKSQRVGHLLLASVFFGLAASTKYPAAPLWLLVPMSAALSRRCVLAIFSRPVLYGCLLFLASFFIGSPYILIAPHEFLRDLAYQTSSRGVAFSLQGVLLFFRDSIPALWAGASTLAVLFGAGTVFCVMRPHASTLFVLSGLFLASSPLLVAGGFKYARYYLPLVPFLAIAAGCAAAHMLRARHAAACRVVHTAFHSRRRRQDGGLCGLHGRRRCAHRRRCVHSAASSAEDRWIPARPVDI